MTISARSYGVRLTLLAWFISQLMIFSLFTYVLGDADLGLGGRSAVAFIFVGAECAAAVLIHCLIQPMKIGKAIVKELTDGKD